MTARDDAIDAVVEAITGEEAIVTGGYYGASWRIDHEHAVDIAPLAVDAAEPILRAQLRQAIEKHLYTSDPATDVCWQFEPRSGETWFDLCARIAEHLLSDAP